MSRLHVLSFICLLMLHPDGASISQTQKPEKKESTLESSKRSSRPIGYALATVDCDGVEYQVYAIAGSDTVTYIAPYLFVTDDKAIVDVQTSPAKPGSSNADHIVTLTLKRSGQTVRSAIAKKLRDTGVRPNITSANVIPAEISNIEVNDISPGDGTYAFEKYTCANPTSQRISLHARVAGTDVAKFKEWITAGNVTFQVTQKLFAETVIAEESFDLEGLMTAELIRRLNVDGSATGGNPRAGTAATLTQKGADALKYDVCESLRVTTRRMGKPESGDTLERVFDAVLSSLVTEDTLLFGASEEVWQDGLDEVWDVGDLKASEINNLREESKKIRKEDNTVDKERAKTFYERWKEKNSRRKRGGGNFKYGKLSLGGSGSFKRTDETEGALRETERSKDKTTKNTYSEDGIAYQLEGDIRIPIGITLYRVSENAATQRRRIAVSNIETEQSLKTITFDVSTEPQPAWRIVGGRIIAYESDLAKVRAFLTSEGDPVAKKDHGDLKLTASAILQKGTFNKIGTIKIDDSANALVYVVTVNLVSDTGETVIQQLIFRGRDFDGQLKPVAPNTLHSGLKFYLWNDDIMVQLADTVETPLAQNTQ